MVVTILASTANTQPPSLVAALWSAVLVTSDFAGGIRSPSGGFRLSRDLCPNHLCLLIADALIVGCVRLHWETRASLTLRNQLQQMKQSGCEYEVETNSFDDSATVACKRLE